jgi:hypothetical protein
LHLEQISGQLQAETIAEMHRVSWVYAAQVEVVFHALAQGSIGFGKYFRHQKQGWTDVEAVSISINLVAASAGPVVFLDDRDLESIAGETTGSGNPADPSTDD